MVDNSGALCFGSFQAGCTVPSKREPSLRHMVTGPVEMQCSVHHLSIAAKVSMDLRSSLSTYAKAEFTSASAKSSTGLSLDLSPEPCQTPKRRTGIHPSGNLRLTSSGVNGPSREPASTSFRVMRRSSAASGHGGGRSHFLKGGGPEEAGPLHELLRGHLSRPHLERKDTRSRTVSDQTEAVGDLIKQCHVRPGDLLGNLLPKAQTFALKDGTNFRVQGPMQIGLLGMKIAGPRGPSLKGPSSEIGDPGGPLGQQVEEYAFRGIRQGSTSKNG